MSKQAPSVLALERVGGEGERGRGGGGAAQQMLVCRRRLYNFSVLHVSSAALYGTTGSPVSLMLSVSIEILSALVHVRRAPGEASGLQEKLPRCTARHASRNGWTFVVVLQSNVMHSDTRSLFCPGGVI